MLEGLAVIAVPHKQHKIVGSVCVAAGVNPLSVSIASILEGRFWLLNVRRGRGGGCRGCLSETIMRYFNERTSVNGYAQKAPFGARNVDGGASGLPMMQCSQFN